jgi:hypothetical protein
MVLIGSVVMTLLASLLTSSPAAATGFLSLPVPPPKDRIVIDVVTVNGTGCPAGTAAVAVSPDNTAFTVTYSAFTAMVGVGALPLDFRKNCQINLVVNVPSGFTYAVSKTDFRGFGTLAKGASAVQGARYYFQGQSQTAFSNHHFNGATQRDWQGDWQTTDEVDVAQLVYAPCGVKRNFNINTTLTVNAGSSDVRKTTSFFNMDSTDGALDTIYHFAWATCPR